MTMLCISWDTYTKGTTLAV